MEVSKIGECEFHFYYFLGRIYSTINFRSVHLWIVNEQSVSNFSSIVVYLVGYLNDSNTAAHCVGSDIFNAVFHLELHA